MEMMLETDEALSQIAFACGFSDQAHLSRIFRRTQGISPARWRRLRRILLRNVA
jgi:AraC family transcriptional regulator